MSQHFREVVPPGTNYEFVGKAKLWFGVSIAAVIGSILMLFINVPLRGSMLNWSIDFRGGTEIIASAEPGVTGTQVREALEAAGFDGADVSSFALSVEGKDLNGFLVRLVQFGAVDPAKATSVSAALAKKFPDRGVEKSQWSGDQLFIRSKKPITQEELAAFFKEVGLDMKPWSQDQVLEAASPTGVGGEYEIHSVLYGLDREVHQALEKGLGGPVVIRQVDAVGAKAGEKLRNQGIAALLYAIAFILLYIAIRFDLRYGPGGIIALMHDATIVVGVYAVFWIEFSLTTVAALLTVIGYSINDTIVIFDRIRENEGKLKDKKLDRVVNVAVNETLSRTILTSATVFVVTLALAMVGTGQVRNFAIGMTVGVVAGAYSTIFIASPLMLWLHRKFFAGRTPKTRGRPLTQPTTE